MLDQQNHDSLALLSIDCAGQVLLYFEEKYTTDYRTRKAVEAGRAWAREDKGS